MYCIKCGTNNSDTAVYCRKCGELIEAEDETRVAVRLDAGEIGKPRETEIGRKGEGELGNRAEEHIFSIGPTTKFVKLGYVLAALGALLLVAILSVFGVSAWISILFGMLLFLIPAFQHVKTKLVRYSLNDTQIEVDSGLISRKTRNIPLRRIQDVTVTTSVMQRLLGYGDLVVDNASEDAEKIVLKNIDSPKERSEQVLKQMHLLER